MVLYTAGEVGINIRPDTRGFGAELRRKLAKYGDITLPVNFDADDNAAYATYRRWEGREVDVPVNFKTDPNSARAYLAQQKKLREAAEEPIRPDFDLHGVEAKQKALQKYIASMSDQLKKQQADYQQVTSHVEELAAAEEKARKVNEQASRARKAGLDDAERKYLEAGRRVDSLNERLTDLKKTRDELRYRKSDDARNELQSVRSQIDQVTTSLRNAKNERNSAFREFRRLEKEQSKLTASEDGKLYDAATQKLKAAQKQQARYAKAVANTEDSLKSARKSLRDYTAQLKSNEAQEVRVWEAREKALDQLAGMEKRANGAKKALRDMFPMGTTDKQYQKLVADVSNRLNDINFLQKELHSGRLNAARDVKLLTDSYKQFDKQMQSIDKGIDKLNKPLELQARLDEISGVRESIERAQARLNAAHLDVPAEVNLTYDNAIKQLRDLEQKVKLNPDKDWSDWRGELQIGADLDEASRELRRWKDRHEEFELDVDLQSKLASAHLAYLTRPRTVEIFAKVRDTQLGKLLNGVTYGATGLAGVQNKFDSLVNAFDNLDRTVPRIAAVGTVLASLSAGALNLSGSILGVGSSLVSMSKVALAAPAALMGVGAAVGVAMYSFETFKNDLQDAETAFTGFGDKLDEAFKGKALPATIEFLNTVGAELQPALLDLADAESEVMANLVGVATAAHDAGYLATIMDNTNLAVKELSPGLEHMVAAFLNLSDLSSQYLPRAARYISDLASGWADWVNRARETGAVENALEQVIEQAGYLKNTVKSVISIFSGLYSAIAINQNGIEQFSHAVGNVADAVNSVRFQETLKTWSAAALVTKDTVRDSFSSMGDALYTVRETIGQVMVSSGEVIASFGKNLSRVIKGSESGLRTFATGTAESLKAMFDALGDNSHVINELLTMVGKLARTFGNTLAAAIRTASPLLQGLAKTAGAVADAFNALPDSLKGGIAIWATFGRAASTAMTTLKTSMLTNIQDTLQYQKTMASLGMSADQAKVKFSTLAVAMAKLNGADVVSSFGQARSSVDGVGTSVVGLKAKLSNAAGVAKSFGSSLLSAFGGPVGVGVTAAFAAIAAAIGDYQHKAQATESANMSLADSMRRLATDVEDSASAVSSLRDELSNIWSSKEYGRAEGLGGWLNGITDEFKTAEEAAKEFGVSSTELTNAIINGGSDYTKVQNRVNSTVSKAKDNFEELKKAASGSVLDKSSKDAENARNKYNKLSNAQEKLTETTNLVREEMVATAMDTAKLNGVSEKTIRTYANMNVGMRTLMEVAGGEALKQNASAKALELKNQILSKGVNTIRNATHAEASYYEALDSTKSAIESINEMASYGQRVWNDQAKSFDLTTSAGRLAASTIDSLVLSANDWLDASAAQGMSADALNERYTTLRNTLIDQATALTGNRDKAAAYVDQLLTTPDHVKTKVDLEVAESKALLAQYVETMSILFPAGQREDLRTIILKMVMEGKTPEEIMEAVQKATEGKYTVVINSDGKPAIVETEALKKKLEETGVKIPAEVDGVSIFENVEGLKKELEAQGITLKVNDDGSIQLFKDGVELAKKEAEKDPAKVEVDADTDKAQQKTDEMKKDAEKDPAKVPVDADPIAFDSTLEEKRNEAEGATFKVSLDANPEMFDGTLFQKKEEAESGEVTIPLNANPEQFDSGVQERSGQSFFESFIPLAALAGLFDSDMGSRAGQTFLSAFIPLAALAGLFDTDKNARAGQQFTLSNIPLGALPGLFDADKNRRAGQQFALSNIPLGAITSLFDAAKNARAGRTLGRSTIDVDANTSPFTRSVSAFSGKTVATAFIDVVERITQKITGSRATGGRIHGPGTGTSDSIPMMLSNGEMVIKASSVRKLDAAYGSSFLNALNATGSVNQALNAKAGEYSSRAASQRFAYATGGRVSSDAVKLEVNLSPVINVEVPDGAKKGDTYVTQNFDQKIVRSDADLHVASAILYRNAARTASMVGR